MWILGLDVGDVRVGLAIANTTTKLVKAENTLIRAKNQALDAIIRLCAERSITQIIVGLPLSEDGSENLQCERVRAFVRRISKRSQLSIRYVDEYLSSQEAEQRLIDQNQHRPIIKEQIDAYAAVIILERYFAGDRTFD